MHFILMILNKIYIMNNSIGSIKIMNNNIGSIKRIHRRELNSITQEDPLSIQKMGFPTPIKNPLEFIILFHSSFSSLFSIKKNANLMEFLFINFLLYQLYTCTTYNTYKICNIYKIGPCNSWMYNYLMKYYMTSTAPGLKQ